VAAYDTTAGANYVFGFAVASSGALTPLNGGSPLAGGAIDSGACTNAYLNAPFISGTCPAAIASDPSSSYVYVTDSVNNQVHAYSVASGTGLLTPLASPVKSGDQPSAIVVDPAYPYVYVANAQDSTVTAYSISNGALTWLGSTSSGGGTYTTGSEPVAIGIDPSTNHFLYTANFLGSGINGNVSGFELSPTAGTLIVSKSSPYTSNALPTAVAAIPHGSAGKTQ
jgi:DNA-binding beta-propeller fold protein YncE